MRAITVMFDSLNRKYLEPYAIAGFHPAITPNFTRLAQKTVRFDRFYAGSLPCMPARREMHTGRYNFLHRAWGPLEPFDDSMPLMLSQRGVYTHFISDHSHYWQDGGLTYHTKYCSAELIRGQEGDLWKGGVNGYTNRLDFRRQDTVNRKYMREEEQHPHARCFEAAAEFLRDNHQDDNWYLHLEYFDPHEPFFVPDRFRKLYPEAQPFEWPPYERCGDPMLVRAAQLQYSALVSMCDHYLGKLLDLMDRYGLWDDTMLIVNTDHGYLLGEHGYFAKNYMPTYEEIAHIPFFIHHPEFAHLQGDVCDALCQTIDIAPTILDHFGVPSGKDMQGISLSRALLGEDVRAHALFGYFGKHVNITDGRHVYMRGAVSETAELNNYTLMPMNIFEPFPLTELRQAGHALCEDFSFTKGVPLMRIPTSHTTAPQNSSYQFNDPYKYGSLLFDLQKDPEQDDPITGDSRTEATMIRAMRELLRASDAPPEQYTRLGLEDKYDEHIR